MKCIDNCGFEHMLTVGKHYEILDWTQDGEVFVITDGDDYFAFNKNRFA